MNNNDLLSVLRKLFEEPSLNQRKLAKELDFSLGKLNYIVKALKKKGLLKVKNFKANKKKLNYIYLLTPTGISFKTKLTINYMKKISKEYENLKEELNRK